jgi:peptidoglycan/xylan/chitin deacetylase (PgdA/CDA1 family)
MTRSGPLSRLARRSVAAALYFSGTVRVLRRRRAGQPGALILRYHSIGGGPGLRDPLVVSERRFASHVRYLRRAHPVVPLDDVVSRLDLGQPLPPGAVAVTFDDGYRDNHDIALPILRRYECPATVFVVVESVQTGEPPWPQRLWGLLRAVETPGLRVAWASRRTGRRLVRRFDLRTADARTQTYRAIKAVAAELDGDDRAELFDRITRATGRDGHGGADGGPAMLDWDQVRALARQDVTIGSHTMTHPRVSLLDTARAEHELLESRVALESTLGVGISLFAYPFGTSIDFDPETRHAVVKAGYRGACTTIEGRVGPEADPLALPRLKARDEPVWMFAMRLLAAQRSSRLLAWITGP